MAWVRHTRATAHAWPAPAAGGPAAVMLRPGAAAAAAAARGLPALLFTARHEAAALAVEAGGRASAGAATYAVGLAARARDAMGTPTSAEALVAEGDAVEEGAPLALIRWSGVVDSASDELYHSRWDVVDGETVVRAPFAGVAETLNSELLSAPKRLDELAEGSEGGCSMAEGEDVPDDAWLLVVRSSPAAVEAALRTGSALCAADYADMLRLADADAEADEGRHPSY